jgi:hypothetical protein
MAAEMAGIWREQGATYMTDMLEFFWTNPVSRFLIVLGILLIVAGIVWPLLQRAGLGRLPGDIVVEGENFRFYFPIVTSIVISILLTLILWLIKR